MSETTPARTEDETATAEQRSRLKGYDKRLEEWLGSLKNEAGQRSPEVLGALAAKAKDVAEYLEKMAEQARSKKRSDETGSTLEAPEPTHGVDEKETG